MKENILAIMDDWKIEMITNMKFVLNRRYGRIVFILLILYISIMLTVNILSYLIGFHAGLRSNISMYPTFEASDRLWVNRISYRFIPPARGDVIVSRDVTGWRRDPEDRYIALIHPIYWNVRHNKFAISPPFRSRGPTWVKRLIGLPGDSIKIVYKQVYIDGIPYIHGAEHFQDVDHRDRLELLMKFFEDSEPDVLEKYELQFQYVMYLYNRDNMEEILIPEGYYFIIGDNRDISHDSRHFGLVAREDIIGRVTHKVYSRRDERVQFFKRVN